MSSGGAFGGPGGGFGGPGGGLGGPGGGFLLGSSGLPLPPPLGTHRLPKTAPPAAFAAHRSIDRIPRVAPVKGL